MTTHAVDPRFMPATHKQAAAKPRHPALTTATAIVGCVLVAVLIGLVLTALVSGGQNVTVQHQIGHAASVAANGTVSADAAQAVTAKAATVSANTRPWRETLRGRAIGGSRALAAEYPQQSVAQQ